MAVIEQRMFVKALPSRRVKDPYSLKLLAPEGEWKPRESYWMRRVLFGDCIECTPTEVPVSSEPERVSSDWASKPTKKSKKHEPPDGHGENQ